MANAETEVLRTILLSIQGISTLFRNNVGSLKTRTGGHVTFGLCEGSSDLVGWRSITVTQNMVGRQLAIFTALEIKSPGAHTNPKHLKKQTHFIETVRKAGGIAGFADSHVSALKILNSLSA